MINIPTLIFFVGIYLAYRYFVKPYMIDPVQTPKKDKKEDDKGDFIDYEEVDE